MSLLYTVLAGTESHLCLRASRRGWLKGFEVFSEASAMLAQLINQAECSLNHAECSLNDAQKATVVSRPVGAGWLKGFEVFNEAGNMLAQLTADERREPWAGKETSFTVEVMKIEEPAGREGKGPARKVGARF
jgi:hypothetical protein